MNDYNLNTSNVDEIIRQVDVEGAEWVITRDAKPVAIVVPYDEYMAMSDLVATFG